MTTDPRLQDVARNMVFSLDVLTGSPGAGRELALFFVTGTHRTWWDLRDKYAELLEDDWDRSGNPEDFWRRHLSPQEIATATDRAERFKGMVLGKEKTRGFFKDTADFTILAPDVLAPGRVYDLETLPLWVLLRVCGSTAAHHTAHLVGHPELDVDAMRDGLDKALTTVLSRVMGAGRFTVGALGYRPDYSGPEDPVFVMPISKDAEGYRMFFQLRVRKDGAVSWSVRVYTRNDHATSAFDLVAGRDVMDTLDVAVMFSAVTRDDMDIYVQEFPLPVPESALAGETNTLQNSAPRPGV